MARHILIIEHSFAEPLVLSDISTSFGINLYRMKAVLSAIQKFGAQWAGKKLLVFTDNDTTHHGFSKQTFASPVNQDLRTSLLLAAKYDIQIIPTWILGKDNELADALSRFKDSIIANLWPSYSSPSPRR